MEQVSILFGEAPKALSGYGYGYGYGSGDGDGYGSGYGDGSGSGYGSGSGDGSGYGDGYGDGYGYGSGSGSPEYWQATIPHFAAKWPDAQRERLAVLQGDGATIAFWLSDATGRPCNGGASEPAHPGMVQVEPGPLRLCARGTLHATLTPTKWHGERWWIVALIGDVVSEDDKFGALKREIIGEAL